MLRPVTARLFTYRKILAAITVLYSITGNAPVAHAFVDATYFFADVSEGGSAGRWFTGSPADGYTCDTCHTGAQSWPLYVENLPWKGYVPGVPYDLRVSWPEFRQHEQALLTANPMADPTNAVIIELVGEAGLGAGTIEVPLAERVSLNEKCSRPEGGNAVDLWTVDGPDAQPYKIRQKCTADGLNMRCLVAVKACGAGEVKLKWTPPSEWQGAIWFNAAMVTTDEATGIPNDSDGVTAVTYTLPPAATGAAPVQVLDGNCSVRSAGHSSWLALLGWLAGVQLLIMRRRRRR